MSMVFRSRRKIFRFFERGLLLLSFFCNFTEESMRIVFLRYGNGLCSQKNRRKTEKAKFNDLYLNGISIFI